MKYFYVLLAAILFTGCVNKTAIEFKGTAPDITDGKFTIRNADGLVLCTAPIKSGKFELTQDWKQPGYYFMEMGKTGVGSQGFDVYLQPGKYLITVNKIANKYPQIQSTSKKENDLNAFYHLFDEVAAQLFTNVDTLLKQSRDPKTKLLPVADQAQLDTKLKAAQLRESRSGLLALWAYVLKNPDNEIGVHIMANMNYAEDPQAYYEVYKKFSDADKNSPLGKSLQGFLVDLINKQKK
jgi:hypothetical protein